MKQTQPLPALRLFAEDTTADLEALHDYLLAYPGHAENGYHCGSSLEAMHMLGHLDRVETTIRIFVSGCVNNLADVRAEVSDFYQCRPDAAPRMVAFALDVTMHFLVDGQYYEIIPRLNIVRKYLQKRFQIKQSPDFERFTGLTI